MTKKILTIAAGLAVAVNLASAATTNNGNYNKNLLDGVELGVNFGLLDKENVKGISIKQYIADPVYVKMDIYTNKNNFNAEIGLDLAKYAEVGNVGIITSFGVEKYNVTETTTTTQTTTQEVGLDQYQTVVSQEILVDQNKSVTNIFGTQALAYKITEDNMLTGYLAVGTKNTKIGIADTIYFNKHLKANVNLFKRLNYSYKNTTNVLFNISYTF